MGNARFGTFFAPEDGVMARVLEMVGAAEQSIRFMPFSFTAAELAVVMAERASAGVLVEGLFEAQAAESPYSQYGPLRGMGIRVLRDGNPALMHHKVMMLDRLWVIAGTFNLTGNADRQNDENVLIIRDENIAAAYLRYSTGSQRRPTLDAGSWVKDNPSSGSMAARSLGPAAY
jgi:phosphatidylserine/phosphatidylglycerophosphate/cardiolipin synthase-like enzyme